MEGARDAGRVRLEEREALLRRVVEGLREDRRVVGAWVFGSLGKGTADEWSDVDLRVVVRDEALLEVTAVRHEIVNSVGEALIEQDVPQNAPPGGAFRCAVYPGTAGLLPIEWTWRGYAGAQPAEGTKVLFGEAALRRAPADVERARQADERNPALSRSLFFWAMSVVTTKYIARGSHEQSREMLAMVTDAQRWVRERIGAPSGERPGGPVPGEGASMQEYLEALRQRCRGMEDLLPQLNLHELTPAGRMDRRGPAEVYRLFEVVESTLG